MVWDTVNTPWDRERPALQGLWFLPAPFPTGQF